jgi:predicted extracellular nuclease
VYGEAYNTPGAENEIVPEPPLVLGSCSDPATFIHEVQGSAFSSPLNGELVVVEGVVVGDFQVDGLDGFFLQEEDSDIDGNDETSEGIFIYDPPITLDVSRGDVVRVLGSVSEFFDMTRISLAGITYCSESGNASTEVVMLPVSSVGYLERFEGMAVSFPQELRIAEFFNFDRFGEIVLTTERQFQPTAVFEPGSPEAAALADINDRSRIVMDDGRGNQNPDPAIHPNGLEFTLDNRFRGGDLVQNLTGVMDYNFGEYKVQPTQGADYTPTNPRPSQPDPVGGDLRVAAFNVLNYFTTFGSRGANDLDEFNRQRDKIFAALAEIDADVVGLVEIENNGTAVEDLVEGLNHVVGEGTYAYIDTGVMGPDEIAVALIYKPAKVTPLGDHAVLDTDNFLDPNDTGEPRNRPALAQSFRDLDNAGIFTVVVNHFKSKGTPCGEGDDDPEQGSCKVTRTLAAGVLLDWLAGDPTGSGDEDFLVIGDINSYDHEDPIDVFRYNNYADLIFEYLGENAYTYVFDGQLGYLDYALSSPAIRDEVSGTTVWHINADEPDILDYDTTYKQDAQDELYEPNAFRSSDHDPVIVGLALESDNEPPVCDGAAPSMDIIWPVNHKFVLVGLSGVTDPDGDPFSITIDSIYQDEPVDDGGDGSTAPDAIIHEDGSFEIRAERNGDGNGRVYTIAFTVTDYYGDTCSSLVRVGVPHDQGKKAEEPVDDGPLYDSTEIPEVDVEAELNAEGELETSEEVQADQTPEPTEQPTEEPDAAVTPEPPAASNGNGKKDK